MKNTSLSHDDLLRFNRAGLIPGPGEEEAAFLARVHYCLEAKKHLPQEVVSAVAAGPLSMEAVAQRYDSAPEWVPVIYTNHRLPFWQGGCAWIYQLTETDPTTALIQLRSTFKTSATYLGIYHREELFSHELVHVGRLMFQEPQFEEMLAYATSACRFRRWLGPIIQSAAESIVFILILFVLFVFDIFLVSTHQPDAYQMVLWLKLIPAVMIGGAVARLWKKHRIFDRCLERLVLVAGKENALPIIYRLTDREIVLFSRSSPDAIRAYAAEEKSLRWQCIRAAYSTASR